MALRFEAEATSLVGIQWRLRIYDSEYGGATVIPFKVGGDIFELAYDGADDDRVQYIIPSQLIFTYIIEGAAQEELIDNLKTAKEGRYLLEVEYLDTTYQPYWRGVLFADQVEVADEYWPQEVRLTASDDLKALDSIPYKVSDTVPYTGLSSLGSHLINCINKVRWISLNTGTRTTFEDFFRSTQQATPVVTAATAIAIEHHMLATISDNGTAEYPSTYEVLAEVLALMGLRLFQVNGAFMTQSIFACEADVANAKLTPISSTAVGSTSTVARTTFSPGANYVKERGWTHGYLHPLSEVNRKYNFTGVIYYGFISFYNANELLTGVTDTLSTFADTSFQQGDVASLSFRVRLGWAGDNSLTGNNRCVRHKISMTWKMGQYYLNRTATINSGTLTNYPVPGESTAAVVNYSYNAPSWSTNSANVVEFITPPLVMKQSGFWEGEFGITGPAFAADLSNSTSTVAFDMVAVLSSGSTSTSYDNQFTSGSNNWQRQQILSVKLISGDTFEIDGQEALYRAINDDDNGRAVLELPETRIGDRVADNQNFPLKALNGSAAWVPTETWYTDDDATTRTIHRLHCYEMLSGQNRTVPTQFGTLHERPATTVPGIRMHHLFVDDAQYYGIFHFTFSAYMNTYDIAVWKLDRELTNMSVPGVELFGDPTGPPWGPGGLPAAQIEALQVADTVTDATVGTISGTVTGISTKLELIYDTFQPKGVDYAKTLITYESNKTDGTALELDQTTAQLKSASGNSLMAISEASPGEFRIDLQDDTTPTPLSINVAFATADKTKAGLFGLGTEAPEERLHVLGNAKVDGNIIVTGSVDGVDISTLDTIATKDIPVYNNTASTITKGTIVRENGAQSATGELRITAFNSLLSVDAHRILGVLTEDIAAGASGYARAVGHVRGLNTNSFSVGTLLYASATTAGAWTSALPTAFNSYAQIIGWVTKQNTTTGEIFVRIVPATTLENLANVKDQPPSVGQVLVYDGSVWAGTTQATYSSIGIPGATPPAGGFKSVWFQDSAGNMTYDEAFTYDTSTNTLEIDGTATTAGVLRLGEATNNGTNYVGIQAPASLAANTTYTLPTADGTSGQVLSTNGSGTLSFVTRKATQVTGKTVATTAWSLVSGFYEASISESAISATSIVDVIPDNGSAATAATAGVLPRTDSSSGAVKIYATATPAATLTVTLNIFDL